MCGCYVFRADPKILPGKGTRWNPEEALEPSWNVAPTEEVWAVLERPDRESGTA